MYNSEDYILNVQPLMTLSMNIDLFLSAYNSSSNMVGAFVSCEIVDRTINYYLLNIVVIV